MKIAQGNTYHFKVIRHEVDGMSNHMLLQDPFGEKHLLFKGFYTHLNIDHQEVIECRVDKINCSGKVYLEPADPHYREGLLYAFPNLGKTIANNYLGEEMEVYLSNDRYGRPIQIPVEIAELAADNVEIVHARLVRIKRGKMIFLQSPAPDAGEGVEIGKEYLFRVKAETRLGNGDLFYVLEDPFLHKHYLAKKYFQGWGIEVGKEWLCKVVKWSTKGFYYLEPKHPFYKLDEVYSFKINGFDHDSERIRAVYIRDIFNHVIKVDWVASPDIAAHATLELQVSGFQRGIPILSAPSTYLLQD